MSHNTAHEVKQSKEPSRLCPIPLTQTPILSSTWQQCFQSCQCRQRRQWRKEEWKKCAAAEQVVRWLFDVTYCVTGSDMLNKFDNEVLKKSVNSVRLLYTPICMPNVTTECSGKIFMKGLKYVNKKKMHFIQLDPYVYQTFLHFTFRLLPL